MSAHGERFSSNSSLHQPLHKSAVTHDHSNLPSPSIVDHDTIVDGEVVRGQSSNVPCTDFNSFTQYLTELEVCATRYSTFLECEKKEIQHSQNDVCRDDDRDIISGSCNITYQLVQVKRGFEC